ncbi:MAG: elongation factor P [Bacteroidetes bacterium]|nr:elongation factor P [Bacteroidota bacterium]
MASTSDIRNGLVIRFNHDLYSVVEFLHVKPGKGAAFVRTKLKSLTTGRVLENTFPSGAKLEPVRVERRKFQYLYPDGSEFIFMNTETFEQISIPAHQIEAHEFLQEGQECEVMINADDDDAILTVDLPNFVVMTVTYTEPGLKGDTATNTLKPATVDDTAEVRVPLFVNVGDKVRIDTRTKQYVERVKE